MKQTIRLTFAALAALAFASASQAQDRYPTRPITLVVPFAPGSGTDIATRSLARSLGETLNAAVVVDNKPGANGAIGAQAVARARPDGYTLLVGSATTNAANYAFFPGKLGYEPSTFEMVAGMMGSSLALHVVATSPWQSVADLVAAGKKAELNCGSGNAVTQVACEIFKRQAQIQATTIPYKSNPQSLTDLVGGQISFAFADTAASQALVQGKQLRVLAIAGTERNASVPDVRTFAEQGMPKFQFTAWTGLFAPKGTPEAIQEALNAGVNRWLASPEGLQLRDQTGSMQFRFSRPEAQRFVQSEVERWATYIKESNVRPE